MAASSLSVVVECTIWYMSRQSGDLVTGAGGATGEAGEAAVPPARQRLLDAVVAHFTAQGLADQSLRRIAEAIGTSHRMLLYHFGSKDGLLLAVVREVEARTQGRLAALGGDAFDETETLIRRMWTYLADPALGDFERLFFALYGRALQGDAAIRSLLDDDIAHWLDANVALAAPLGVAPDVVRTHARLGLAVTRGLLLDLLATGDRAEVEAALEVFAAHYRGRWWESQPSTGISDRAS
jgi:AcrR family transcriptional regulator